MFARNGTPGAMEEGEAPSAGGGEEGEAPARAADESRRHSHSRSGPSAAVTPPARARAGAYAGLLAGWASGGIDTRTAGSAPPKTSAYALGGYAGLRRERDERPHTTGKVGRDRKRARGTSNEEKRKTARPCLFWRQGACAKGDACGYVHGDSQVPCTQFTSAAGCRFGDKCAFKHVPRGRPDPASNAEPVKNPFATHAENCGCETCRPASYRPAAREDEGEDGEVMRVPSPDRGGDDGDDGDGDDGDDGDGDGDGDGDETGRTNERRGDVKKTKKNERLEKRDAVLARCRTIASPETIRAWSGFADPEVRRAQRAGPAPAPYKR